MTLITNMWFIFITNVFEIPIMTDHTLLWFISLIRDNSLRDINSFILYHFLIHTKIGLRKFVDNIYHLLQTRL